MEGYAEYFDPLHFSPSMDYMFRDPYISLKREGLVSQNKTFLVLPRAVLKLVNDGKWHKCRIYTLDSSNVQAMARRFKEEASTSIPWIYGALSGIPGLGWKITVVLSTIDGLRRLASQHYVSASQLSVLMAVGGAFVKYWSLEMHPKYDRLFVTNVYYSVKVGSEDRIYGIYSSKEAFKIRD